jgi:hypothetical protein
MSDSSTSSTISVLGRLFWMMIGPLALALVLYHIVSSGPHWLGLADLAYFVILAGMILGRWLEFRGGAPLKSDGQPAVPADLRRYILQVMVLGPAAWGFARVIGSHFLSR